MVKSSPAHPTFQAVDVDVAGVEEVEEVAEIETIVDEVIDVSEVSLLTGPPQLQSQVY